MTESKTEKVPNFGWSILPSEPAEVYRTTIQDGGVKVSARGQTAEEAQELASEKWDQLRSDNSGSDDKGGCFITTACTSFYGLPDNCRQLTTLRSFRDNVLLRTEAGREAVLAYYRIAPKLVAYIDGSPDRDQELSEIFQNVTFCTKLIEKGKFHDAYENYASMMDQLSRKYL